MDLGEFRCEEQAGVADDGSQSDDDHRLWRYKVFVKTLSGRNVSVIVEVEGESIETKGAAKENYTLVAHTFDDNGRKVLN